MCKKEILVAITIVICLLVLPFLLNWILLRNTIVPIVGDGSTWLSFWGTYVGSILTALMVFATFLTLRKTINLSKTQLKTSWLNSFRTAAADMVSSIDPTAVGQIAQDVNFWKFEQAVEKGHEMEMTVKKSSYLLSSVLREYDAIFDAHSGGKYIDELNDFISPFLQCTGELIQFAIICKFIKEKTDSGHRIDGVQAVYEMKEDMALKQYNVIKDAIQDIYDNDNIEMVVHDTVVELQQNVSAIDIEGLEKLLLKIGSQNAKIAYGAPTALVVKREVKKHF